MVDIPHVQDWFESVEPTSARYQIRAVDKNLNVSPPSLGEVVLSPQRNLVRNPCFIGWPPPGYIDGWNFSSAGGNATYLDLPPVGYPAGSHNSALGHSTSGTGIDQFSYGRVQKDANWEYDYWWEMLPLTQPGAPGRQASMAFSSYSPYSNGYAGVVGFRLIFYDENYWECIDWSPPENSRAVVDNDDHADATGWKEYVLENVYLPENAVYVQLYFYLGWEFSPNVSDVYVTKFYFDDTSGTYPGYGDGDTPGWVWDGTPYWSSSRSGV